MSNTNIASDAAIVESKIAFNTSTGHDHDGTDSKLIVVGAYHFIEGAELIYDTAATFHANPGVVELNGTLLSRTSASTTRSLATAGDWVQGDESASEWVYAYAYNDSGTSWDIKLSDQPPLYYDCNTGHTVGVLRYRDFASVWYRCIGAVRNDGSSNILKFYQDGDWITYDVPQNLLNNGTALTWTDVDCSPYVPSFCQLIQIFVASGATAGYVRPNGSSWGKTAANTDSIWTNSSDSHILTIHTDSSQIIEYVQAATADNEDIRLISYYVGAIR